MGTLNNISFVRMCNWHRLNLKICDMYKQYVIWRFCAPHVHLAVLSLCTWRLKPVWPLPLSGSDALSMQQVPQSHHDQHIFCQTLTSFYNHFEHWPHVRLRATTISLCSTFGLLALSQLANDMLLTLAEDTLVLLLVHLHLPFLSVLP